MSLDLLPAFQEALKKLDKPFFPEESRRAALARFASLGFPKADWESWRRTDVSEAVAHPFQPARLLPCAESAAEPYLLPGATVRLTFVNGFFSPALSDISHLPEGVEAGPLALRPEVPHLGGLVSLEEDPFSALNTALFADGAYVRVTRGVTAAAPIHLLFLTLPDNRPTFLAPRVFIKMGENAEATLLETHAGGAAGHLSAAVTELELGPASRLTHTRRILDLGAGAHLGRVQALQSRGSFYGSHSLVFGGTLVRNRFMVVQEGEGAECSLDGVVLARGRESIDHFTTIDHAAPRGTSREAYKYLLADRSRGAFNGEVIIRPAAQKTESSQLNANLLLSDQALMHTKPDLRIFADDVKAKHGATIGQLNEDMLFYCRSRGLSREEAQKLLTEAFAVDILSRLAYEPLRDISLSAVGSWWGRS